MSASAEKVMVPSIDTIPLELIEQIYGYLPLRDKVALGKTSHRFRDFTISQLYHSATIHTSKASTATSFIEDASKYGGLVRSLRIAVAPTTCLRQHKCKECDPPHKPKNMSQWADQITHSHWQFEWGVNIPALDLLRGDHDSLLPNLDHITVEFPSRFGRHQITCSGDSWEEVCQWEQLARWTHSQVDAVNVALSNRPAGSITHLTLANHPLYGLDVIIKRRNPRVKNQSGFRALLRGLLRFDLSLWAGEGNGSDGLDNDNKHYLEVDEYSQMMECLPQMLFDHLTSVKHVRFQGSLHAPVGQVQGDLTRPLPLGGERQPDGVHMPMLERLELVKIMVDTSLVDFLKTRKGMRPLELVLEDTWAYDHYPEGRRSDGAGKWAMVLDGIRDLVSCSNGLKLTAFRLMPRAEKVEMADGVGVSKSGPPIFRYADMFVPGQGADQTARYHAREKRERPEGEREIDLEAEDELMRAIAHAR